MDAQVEPATADRRWLVESEDGQAPLCWFGSLEEARRYADKLEALGLEPIVALFAG